MNRLIFVCPNPALDLSGHVHALIANEKNYVTRMRQDPGGNALNAARVAHRLGAAVEITGFLGGAAGETITALLREENLPLRFVKIQGATRTNVTVTNDRDHNQTRLTFPGPKIRAAEWKSLVGKLRGAPSNSILIFGGSRPNMPPEFYRRLLKAGHHQSFIVDVPAQDLKQIFKDPSLSPLMIKPNLSEFRELTGQPVRTLTQIKRAATKLTAKCALVCVSLGEEGLFVAIGDTNWLISSPKIKARGSVGAGDSVIGATAAHLARNGLGTAAAIRANPEGALEALRWGAAAGAATAMAEGTQLGRPAAIRRLYHAHATAVGRCN